MAIPPALITDPRRSPLGNEVLLSPRNVPAASVPSLTFPSGHDVPLDVIVMYVLTLLQENDGKFMHFLKEELQKHQATLGRFETQKRDALDKRAHAQENLESGEKAKSIASTAVFACAGIGSLISGNAPAAIAFLATAGASLDKFFGSQGSALIARCLSQVSGESQVAWENRLRTAATLSAVAMTVVGSFSGMPVLQRIVTIIQAGANGYGEFLNKQHTDALYEEKQAQVRCDITKMHIEDQLTSIKELAEHFYEYYKSKAESMDSAHTLVMKALRAR